MCLADDLESLVGVSKLHCFFNSLGSGSSGHSDDGLMAVMLVTMGGSQDLFDSLGSVLLGHSDDGLLDELFGDRFEDHFLDGVLESDFFEVLFQSSDLFQVMGGHLVHELLDLLLVSFHDLSGVLLLDLFDGSIERL